MSHTCNACDAVYDRAGWQALDVVDRLRHDQVSDLISVWPWSTNVVIEVRQCQCGEPLVELTSHSITPATALRS